MGDEDRRDARPEASNDRRDARSVDYRVARIAVAAALSLAILVMVVVDPFLPDYEPSPIVISILGVMVLTLLGLEARDLLKAGPG